MTNLSDECPAFLSKNPNLSNTSPNSQKPTDPADQSSAADLKLPWFNDKKLIIHMGPCK